MKPANDCEHSGTISSEHSSLESSNNISHVESFNHGILARQGTSLWVYLKTTLTLSVDICNTRNDNEVILVIINPLIPATSIASSHQATSVTIAKCGYGRPRKEPHASVQEVLPKCKLGRPCKQQQVTEEPVPKHKWGRPWKAANYPNSNVLRDVDPTSWWCSSAMALSSPLVCLIVVDMPYHRSNALLLDNCCNTYQLTVGSYF